ncbi:hypothetical protein Bbelb_327870 [Branchiostoma belcheri]|nr:hypothetical protein Bbelb_327870 [Branchiostoma belcheri]
MSDPYRRQDFRVALYLCHTALNVSAGSCTFGNWLFLNQPPCGGDYSNLPASLSGWTGRSVRNPGAPMRPYDVLQKGLAQSRVFEGGGREAAWCHLPDRRTSKEKPGVTAGSRASGYPLHIEYNTGYSVSPEVSARSDSREGRDRGRCGIHRAHAVRAKGVRIVLWKPWKRSITGSGPGRNVRPGPEPVIERYRGPVPDKAQVDVTAGVSVFAGGHLGPAAPRAPEADGRGTQGGVCQTEHAGNHRPQQDGVFSWGTVKCTESGQTHAQNQDRQTHRISTDTRTESGQTSAQNQDRQAHRIRTDKRTESGQTSAQNQDRQAHRIRTDQRTESGQASAQN